MCLHPHIFLYIHTHIDLKSKVEVQRLLKALKDLKTPTRSDADIGEERK